MTQGVMQEPTLFLGEFGRGDLAGEALQQAAAPLGRAAIVATDDPEATARILPHATLLPPNTPTPPEARRALLTGPMSDHNRAVDLILRLGLLRQRGLRIGLRSLSLFPWGPLYRPAPEVRAVLEVLDEASARDHRTLGSMVEWRCPWWAGLEAFPEGDLLPELPPPLPADLPAGPRLGLSVSDSQKTREVFAKHEALVAEYLAPYDGWTVIPLPVVRQGEGGSDDLRAIRDCAARFLPRSPVLETGPEDVASWRREMTPARLKGWIASCGQVIGGRDLPVAFAASAGIPCLALAPHADHEAGRAAGSLANRLAPGSRYRVLPS
ncbi:hypothetical protein MVG78_02625 [Roseomonas gilardii subsp. gilardii]|uniref:hypothetical protein n=1 Tax=Roseomonas gilardii TaxID=257708 RepID=UPI001FF71C40|nr:hypothetical protein [Roseomonas gilardii]UPG73094.1 hypothetical protein MVG78_02625 [Roseomonas gilardii subsp. gilardii]